MPSELKPVTVTIETALKLSGLGRTKLYELINQGKLKTINIDFSGILDTLHR